MKDRKELIVEKADEPKPAAKGDSAAAKDDLAAPLALPDPPAAKP